MRKRDDNFNINLLFMFLGENGLIDKFMEEHESYLEDGDRDYHDEGWFRDDLNVKHFFSSAHASFLWVKTGEEYFWADVDTEWCRFIFSCDEEYM